MASEPGGKDHSTARAPGGPKMVAGDNYGIGYKAKIGRMRGDSVGYRPVSKKQLAKPPRSVV